MIYSRLRILISGLACSFLISFTASSATFIVNTTVDAVDANIGDGICQTVSANECTLRAAVQETNVLTGADTIGLPADIYTLSITGYGGDEVGDLNIIDDLTIIGQSKETTTIDGGSIGYSIFEIDDSGSLEIQSITMQNSNGAYGCIYSHGELILEDTILAHNNKAIHSTMHASAYISNTTISNNTPRGGIYSNGVMLIKNSTINDNVDDYWYSGTGFGGGIKNLGPMTLEDSTVSNNYASRFAGGIHNRNELTIVNSTISGNKVGDLYGEGIGGAIYNISFWPMLLYNVTITNNEATLASAIFIAAVSEGTQLKNTIIANNIGESNCLASGELVSLGYNLGDDTTCNLTSSGDIINTNPNLGPLQNNGGLTETHALLAGSPAIDAGSPDCPPPTTDQRGFARPVDGDGDNIAACDIGAYEVQAAAIDIDIKPYSRNNNINPTSSGQIAVAILTSESFDALQVNPNTVQFGPAGAAKVHGQTHVKDIDNDGDADLLFHFRMPETGIQCGDTEATLTGQTWIGALVSGSDNIRTVGCR